MKKPFTFATLTAALALPLFVVAQGAVPAGPNTSYIKTYSTAIISVINTILVPVLMAIALLVFLWGVYKYFILGAADETSRTEGRKFTLWGIIGFVVIVSLWGLVNLVMGTLGLQAGTAAPPFPQIGTGSYVPGGGGGAGVGVSSAQTAALNQSYQQYLSACANPSSAVCAQATADYNQIFNSTYGGGATSVNSGLGVENVSPALQAAATAAYQACTGTGPQCQDIYACVLNGGTAASCQTGTTGGTTSCPAGYSYDYNDGCVADGDTSSGDTSGSDSQQCTAANGCASFCTDGVNEDGNPC